MGGKRADRVRPRRRFKEDVPPGSLRASHAGPGRTGGESGARPYWQFAPPGNCQGVVPSAQYPVKRTVCETFDGPGMPLAVLTEAEFVGGMQVIEASTPPLVPASPVTEIVSPGSPEVKQRRVDWSVHWPQFPFGQNASRPVQSALLLQVRMPPPSPRV